MCSPWQSTLLSSPVLYHAQELVLVFILGPPDVMLMCGSRKYYWDNIPQRGRRHRSKLQVEVDPSVTRIPSLAHKTKRVIFSVHKDINAGQGEYPRTKGASITEDKLGYLPNTFICATQATVGQGEFR